MDKDILKILLSKKPPFIKVWCWLYANSDDDGIVIFDYKDIMITCGVTKTIIFRALELQSLWNVDSIDKTVMLRKSKGEFITMYCQNPAEQIFQKLETRKKDEKSAILKQICNNTRLILMFVTHDYETKMKQIEEKTEKMQKSRKPTVEQKVADDFNENNQNSDEKNEKKQERKPRKNVEFSLVKKCLAIYIEFYQGKNDGIKPMIDAHQVRSLKFLISHFMKNSPDPSEDNIIYSMDILFNNWGKYPKYIQEQFKLSQIYSNITNIIAYLKSNSKTINKTKTSRMKDFQDAVIEKVNSGDMDAILENLGKN